MIRYDFTGKCVLVTGSSRGIGAAILEGFSRAGAVCYMHYFADPEQKNLNDALALRDKLKAAGNEPNVVSGDVRNMDDVNGIMELIMQRSNGLDILVNNAGVLRDRTIRKMTIDDWRFVMDTNLDGVFHCCKAGTEILCDHGRIINIASIAALHPFHGQTNYAAAKAGVVAITKVLAKELARRGITANAIAPGVIQTTMIGEIKPEVMDGYLKNIPVGRLGKPEDIANAVMFLASEESSYITGQVLPVTGGWF